jgi:lipopolysaccharide-assembly LptC-related protein
MRPLLLSLGTCILVLGAVSAQNSGGGGNMPQLPVGQTFKQFEYPDYQDGKLKATLYAAEARGITLNRAEVTDLKIQAYDNGAVTTTITSPKADLYVIEQKLRTKNTVQIDRTDMVATSQDCDFNLKTKKYLMRTNVKVVLKHFDLNPTPANGAAPASASPKATTSASPAPSPVPPHPAQSNDSLLNSPGAYADTNSAPIAPSSPDTK